MAPSAPPVGANSPSLGRSPCSWPTATTKCGTTSAGGRARCKSERRAGGRPRWLMPRPQPLRQRIKGETMPANKPLQTDGHCSAFGRPCPPLNAGVGRAEKGDQRMVAEGVMPAGCPGAPSQLCLQTHEVGAPCGFGGARCKSRLRSGGLLGLKARPAIRLLAQPEIRSSLGLDWPPPLRCRRR